MAPSQAKSVRWRTAGACLVAGSIWAGSGPAAAVDWQVLYRLSETLRGSDNIQLGDTPQQGAAPGGIGFSSNTSAALDVVARTPTETWRTTGDIGHLIFFGEGVPEDRQRTSMSARSDLLKRTRATDYNLGVHFSQAPATRTVFRDPRFPDLDIRDPDLLDPDLLDPDPLDPDPLDPDLTDPFVPVPVLADLVAELLTFDQIRYGVRGGLVHRRTRTDVLSLSASADRFEFDGVGSDLASARTNMRMLGSWTRRLTPRVTGRANASVRYLDFDDDETLGRTSYDFGVSSDIQATRRLTASLDASAVVTDRFDDDVTAGLRVGYRISYNYAPRRDTSMNFSVAQRVSSTSGLEDLRLFQSARAALTYRINAVSSMNLIGTYSSSSTIGSRGATTEVWRVSPSYRLTLARDWDLSLSYQWVKTDRAQSNTGLLTLSHRGTLLP
jgi:hypothetical protein